MGTVSGVVDDVVSGSDVVVVVVGVVIVIGILLGGSVGVATRMGILEL